MDGSLVRIGSFASYFDAEVAAAHLEAEGIEHAIAKDDGGGAFPSMTGLAGGASIVVKKEDAVRAEEILAAGDA